MNKPHDGVRPRRSDYTDREVRDRHRDFWGWDCAAADVDTLFIEFESGLPVGIVDYKHECTRTSPVKLSTTKALIDLGENKRGQLPVWFAFYWPDSWNFMVNPLNAAAERYFSRGEMLTEFQYVRWLYMIRGRVLPEEVAARLNGWEPL